jgi:hypothetical protein
MWRRTLAIVTFGLALATAGCTSPLGGSHSSGPPPMTATNVNDAMNQSTMKNAHFTAEGFLASGANRYAFTGEGDMQQTPVFAMEMNLVIQTYTAYGGVNVKIIDIGGRTYTRFGAGGWTSEADTQSFPSGTPTNYIGAETRAGVPVWHVEEVSDGNVQDIWVRESDGYIVYMTFTDASGSGFDLLMTSYNASPVIKAP